ARQMVGRTPGNIRAIRPLRSGVIADFDADAAMIKHFIRQAHVRRRLAQSRVVISVPSGATAVERRATKEAAIEAGAREAFLIEEPMRSEERRVGKECRSRW